MMGRPRGSKDRKSKDTRDPRYKLFNTQRNQAKYRGIIWRLEFWEWLQIWEDSGHFHGRGHFKGQWVMARKGDTGPYEEGNVVIMLTEQNGYDATITQGRLKRRTHRP